MTEIRDLWTGDVLVTTTSVLCQRLVELPSGDALVKFADGTIRWQRAAELARLGERPCDTEEPT